MPSHVTVELEELFYRDINLGHQQLEKISSPVSETNGLFDLTLELSQIKLNLWTVSANSRTPQSMY